LTLRVREIYFSTRSDLAVADEDFRIFIQAGCGLPNAQDFHSSIVSLAPELSALEAQVKKGTLAEVRRAAAKDGVLTRVFDTPGAADIRMVVAFYDAFARSRHLGPANEKKMRALANNGALVMSVSYAETRPAAWLSAHVYIVDGIRSRLLYSASCDPVSVDGNRQLVGRANKLLHWQMIQYFRRAGYRLYDFGGISMREQLRTIDEFKQSFGGAATVEFNAMIGISLRGKAFVWLYRQFVASQRKAREIMARLRA
jgi:hypothetical protein